MLFFVQSLSSDMEVRLIKERFGGIDSSVNGLLGLYLEIAVRLVSCRSRVLSPLIGSHHTFDIIEDIAVRFVVERGVVLSEEVIQVVRNLSLEQFWVISVLLIVQTLLHLLLRLTGVGTVRLESGVLHVLLSVECLCFEFLAVLLDTQVATKFVFPVGIV